MHDYYQDQVEDEMRAVQGMHIALFVVCFLLMAAFALFMVGAGVLYVVGAGVLYVVDAGVL